MNSLLKKNMSFNHTPSMNSLLKKNMSFNHTPSINLIHFKVSLLEVFQKTFGHPTSLMK